MSETEKSVKETVELVKAVEHIAVAVKKVAKDGKLNLADAPHVVELGKNLPAIVEGYKDADQIPAEIKDLSLSELQEIASAVYQLRASLAAI